MNKNNLTEAKRKAIYKKAYEEIHLCNPDIGICYLLKEFLAGGDYPLAGWGHYVVKLFPEIQLFAYDEDGFNTDYWHGGVMNDEIRKNILLFAYHML